MKRIFLIITAMLLISLSMPAPISASNSWGYNGSRAISLRDHLPHKPDGLFYTEQWSGSIKFAPNHSMNFNLMYTNITVKSPKAVFRVEYNTPDGKTLEDYDRCELKGKSKPFMLQCGKGMILGSPNNLKLRYKGDKMSVSIVMKALAKPFRPKGGRLKVPGSPSEFYDFMLMIPRAKTIVKIGDKVLKGYGSVDHSYLNTGFHSISRHWLVTTHHDNNITIAFAANMQKSGKTTGWVSITDNNGNSFSTSDIDIELLDQLKDPDKSGYFSIKTMKMLGTNGKKFSLILENMKLKSKKDMLASLSTVEAFVARKISDPMRYAMKGKAKIKWPSGDKVIDTEKNVVVLVKQMNK